MSDLRVALVHDWMANPGGAEKTLLEMHRIWPDAPVFTGAYARERYPEFEDVDVRLIPGMRSRVASRRHQLFTMPRAASFRLLDLRHYDIVISSSSAESKFVRTGDALHVCYCYTPTRYYWSAYDWYIDNFPIHELRWLARMTLPVVVGPLRRADRSAATRAHHMVAISRTVQERIRRYYGRESTVIHPPVAIDRFSLDRRPGDFFLAVGRQVAYKRFDLAVDAFNELGLPLKVAGVGEELPVLRARANSNIEFLGRVSDADLAELLRTTRALVFPGEEDFGIVPVEAMASGAPVIAYGRGGAAETVVDGVTGLHFHDQSAAALASVIRTFDDSAFDPAVIRAHAEPYDEARFASEFRAFVEDAYERHRAEVGRR